MEHFFRKYSHWIHHHIHKLQKKLFHNHAFKKLFESKNARLAVILIIAAAIPLTVLAVQQIQDIRQQAANEPLCSGEYVVNPQPALQDQPVTFSRASGAVVDNNINGFGNGVYADTCQQSGSNVTCTAKGGFATNDPPGKIKKSTWFILEGGAEETKLCQYEIKRVKAEPTRGPTKPPPPAGGACTGTITAACDFANKPVFTISWDLRGSTAPCKVDVKAKTGSYVNNQSTKCEDKTNVKVSGGNIANEEYNLVLTKSGKECFTKTVKANCKGSTGGTPTPTQKAGSGTATPTLKPGQATHTPTPGSATCTNTDVHLNREGATAARSFCTSGGHIELRGGWKISGTDCIVKLYKDNNPTPIGEKKGCDVGNWSTSSKDDDIKAESKYQLKATSNVCTTEKLESEIVTAVACPGSGTNCPQTKVNTPGADDFDPNCPVATPTRVPFIAPIQP